MHKLLKWTGITVGILVGLLLIFFLVTYLSTNRHIHKQYTVKVKPLHIPVDSMVIGAIYDGFTHGYNAGGQTAE